MQKPTRFHIQLQVCAPQASQCRGHQCIGDASDPAIPTSNRAWLPRPSNDDPKHISASCVIVNYWQTSSKLAVQLAAKKKQSINSGCIASVLPSNRNEAGLAHRRSRSGGVRRVDADLAGS